MSKFIYVFTKDDKTKLLNHNYKLLKTDDENGIYIFKNKDQMCFDENEIDFVFSNTLTF